MTKVELEKIIESKTEELEALREELIEAKQKLNQKEEEKEFRKDAKHFAKMIHIAMDELIDQGFSEEDALNIFMTAMQIKR